MKMSRPALVARLAGVRRRGRGAHYPVALKAAAVEFSVDLRAEGRSWDAIGAQLRTNPDTIRRWWHEGHGRPGQTMSTDLVPVDVVEVAPPSPPASVEPLRLTAPNGYRVDGLTVETAASLLRALQ